MKCVCVWGGGGGGGADYFDIIEYELLGIVMSIKFPESVDIEESKVHYSIAVSVYYAPPPPPL